MPRIALTLLLISVVAIAGLALTGCSSDGSDACHEKNAAKGAKADAMECCKAAAPGECATCKK